MDNRNNRETEGRTETVRKTEWAPAALLPEFTQQAGWAYRWIRISLANTADNLNVSSKMREGWEPVKHSDHPEINLQSDPNARYKDSIEIGGLLLCRAPQEMVDQRNAYYRKKSLQQATAVDNSFLKENDARMPLFSDKKSSTSFGRGGK